MQTTEHNGSKGLPGKNEDTKAYLARIRTTIEQSNRIVEQAALRIAETDRLLERQGLTREQVMAMHFSEAQIESVNAELRRRGLDPLAEWESDVGMRQENLDSSYVSSLPSSDSAPDAELAERQRKFGMMMKPFQI